MKKMKETKTDLLVKINNLEHKLEQVIPKKTIMDKIIEREKACRELIEFTIKDCEEETGRPFAIFKFIKRELF